MSSEDPTAASATFPPLTTHFTPPPQCATPYFEGDNFALLLPRLQLSGSKSTIQCLPNSSENPVQYGNILTYSPGWYCPEGWTTAGMLEGLDSASACCPSGYSYSGLQCMGKTTSQSFYLGIQSTTTSNVIIGLSVTETTVTKATVIAAPIVLLNDPITSSSSSTTTTTSSSSSSSTISTSSSPSTTSSSSATPTTTTVPATPQTQLSTAAKAGIGVGVAIAVLIIACLLAYIFISRYRRKKLAAATASTAPNNRLSPNADATTLAASPPQPDDPYGGYIFPKPELDATSPQRYELDANQQGQVQELPNTEWTISELDARNRAGELEGENDLVNEMGDGRK
ncbi:hypothetical protein F5Y16DRAFT_389754 [Xylariaceae sp. FL0255]|nr:hypothetical protein F5Y16DRAFT_389754 [Xylariaceae sp. FL0255]